jgi:hypothetical protein
MTAATVLSDRSAVRFRGSPATAAADASLHPPRVPLVLRVGVTGHRPDRQKRPDPDIPVARAAIAEVLAAISRAVHGVAEVGSGLFALTAHTGQTSVDRRLRLVSALAAGPDQWVAAEAVSLGYELQCVLPFSRQEYAEDFAPPPDRLPSDRAEREVSLREAGVAEAEYWRLLDQATAVFELDGRVTCSALGIREPDSRSYAAVGHAIVRQSDVLLAVWDGQPAHGPGGTAEVVQEALGLGIPVVWVPWAQPSAWRVQLPAWRAVQEPPASGGSRENLTEVIRDLLLPPVAPRGGEGGDDLREEYFAEEQKKGNLLHGCWGVFRMVVCADLSRLRGWRVVPSLRAFQVDPFLPSAREQADREWTTRQSVPGRPMDHEVPAGVRSFVDNAFLPHYAWANGLSMYYGSLHRSAFVVSSLLGTLAVFLALVGVAAGLSGRQQAPWILTELIVILGILGLAHVGRRRRWHQRWIDYRTLAERLRLARCTSLLGGGGPQVVHAGHLASYGNPLRTWMHWHYRAIERAAGLVAPGVRFTQEYLAACREFWRESLIQDQRAYHQRTGAQFTRLDQRLHRAGNAFFILTLAACLLHVTHIRVEGDSRFAWIPNALSGWVTLACAFLPAAGAALATIRGQAETHRVAQRSLAMQDALQPLQMDLATAPAEEEALSSSRLRDCADRVSDLMIRETQDWRVVFQDRPLGLSA